MAFTVETRCSGQFSSPHSASGTLHFITDYETSIAKHFEGLKSFTKEGPDTYRWTFESLRYGGQELTITFVTRFERCSEHEVRIVPVKNTDKAALSGRWHLSPSAQGTKVTFEATLSGELPLPSLMKGMVTPLAQREIKKLFDRYIHNVAKAI
ncbi:MAG: hypothetical protein EBZ49_05570 [Proteobacteria bacterium]|nr:hypothetical protein [Pseudomonadota bacterium]